jgi:nucleotide-binding universal stress UspA family protein
VPTVSTENDAPIVVGVDGSDGAAHALRWAMAEAAVRAVKLRVVEAWAPPVHFSMVADVLTHDDPAVYESAAKQRLAAAVDAAAFDAGSDSVGLESFTMRGYPPDVLLDAARDAAMLVVGSRGRGGFRGLLLGSVSQRCAADARVPVAVVPASAPLPGQDDVVVGVDGSPGSHRALQLAVDEAAVRGARLSVVHTWLTPYAVPPAGFALRPTDRAVFEKESHELLHRMVDTALTAAKRQPKDVELLAVEEPAAPGLLRHAAKAGLLVVGGRGRGALAGLFLGSVSQQCLHHAICAVIVVPERRGDEAPDEDQR